jgi:hypothetical protein
MFNCLVQLFFTLKISRRPDCRQASLTQKRTRIFADFFFFRSKTKDRETNASAHHGPLGKQLTTYPIPLTIYPSPLTASCFPASKPPNLPTSKTPVLRHRIFCQLELPTDHLPFTTHNFLLPSFLTSRLPNLPASQLPNLPTSQPPNLRSSSIQHLKHIPHHHQHFFHFFPNCGSRIRIV